ncbi:lipid droplet-regulating VLDL assembly factor AUP1-like [Coccinella septempunctata]|uniref:lipid droplet-regulating VLDL assembly factor AUP1-like n=1 Tax=Coccinella septempunctata TaxID=41139 RepID=UPI001D06338F|nr:lipid droplet-regulating VLDL assembly factor AUP1-like [Coccinella septempunctata]XP_044754318.1 lipid droplet-regulating VLDL assembly factor AUP1-like [Coccinella septempunctata]
MSNIEVKHLLRRKRLNENEWKFICLLFYLPLGLILYLLRCLLATVVFLLGYLLPDTPFSRNIINKITCLSLGITVTVENIEKRENVEVYIGNSLSLLDGLVVHQATKAISNGPKLIPLISKSLGLFEFGNTSNAETFKKNIMLIQSHEKSPLFFSPEGQVTNGKALIKFESNPFSLTNKVQPICISIERPLLDISISSLGSSPLVDLFFYMFSPLTNYKLRFLDVLEKKNLTNEEFAEIVRQNIATGLKVETVSYTAKDLIELEKRLLIEQKRIRSEQALSNPGNIPVIRRMARQVKEVLPHVPYDAIYSDLYRTRNVDNTITNILEGRVTFRPETPSSEGQRSQLPSTSSISSSNSNIVIPTVSASSSSLNTAASSFSKSAQERSKSFQERKQQLIANARRRYIEKHNLDIPL